jgi:uncharacterized protein
VGKEERIAAKARVKSLTWNSSFPVFLYFYARMKSKHIILLLVISVGLATILYTIYGSKDQTTYINEIREHRDELETFMRTSPESPFADDPSKFTGLKFFPADLKYKITAVLTPISDKKQVLLATNDGKEQRYREYAYAEFDHGGFHNKLLILEVIDPGPSMGKLFLAFGDGTSAETTYGAGRYLDISKAQGSNTITLDFNKAYNPYCAYNDKFSCPLPPSENLLTVPIQAGEKAYH